VMLISKISTIDPWMVRADRQAPRKPNRTPKHDPNQAGREAFEDESNVESAAGEASEGLELSGEKLAAVQAAYASN
jgi:hypothetical protein